MRVTARDMHNAYKVRPLLALEPLLSSSSSSPFPPPSLLRPCLARLRRLLLSLSLQLLPPSAHS